jgi:hypothetical protein
MLGYLIAEWRYWEKGRLRPSVALFAGAGLLALAYAYLQPFLAAAATTAASLIAGWISANRFKRGFGQRRLLAEARLGGEAGLGPASILASRGLVSLASFSLCLLVLSPAIAIITRAWDIAPARIAAALCLWLGAYFLAMSGAFLSGLLLGRGEQPAGAYALAAWLLPTAIWEPARALNPFVQAWAALGRGELRGALLCAGAELLAAALLLAAAGLALGSRREPGRG